MQRIELRALYDEQREVRPRRLVPGEGNLLPGAFLDDRRRCDDHHEEPTRCHHLICHVGGLQIEFACGFIFWRTHKGNLSNVDLVSFIN